MSEDTPVPPPAPSTTPKRSKKRAPAGGAKRLHVRKFKRTSARKLGAGARGLQSLTLRQIQMVATIPAVSSKALPPSKLKAAFSKRHSDTMPNGGLHMTLQRLEKQKLVLSKPRPVAIPNQRTPMIQRFYWRTPAGNAFIAGLRRGLS